MGNITDEALSHQVQGTVNLTGDVKWFLVELSNGVWF
jgi:hypothetical protein